MNLLNNAIFKVPMPVNEPVYDYEPGSTERANLKAALTDITARKIEISLIIGGKEVRTGNLGKVVMPHDHGHVLAEYHQAGKEEIQLAIETAMAAKQEWANLRWEERAGIFLKAADLLAGKYRQGFGTPFDLAELLAKGRRFTEQEKQWLLDRQKQLLAEVVPLQDRNSDFRRDVIVSVAVLTHCWHALSGGTG